MFVFCENVYIFVMHNILKGGESCHSIAGIFYACYLHTAVPYPRDGVLMHPQPLRCYAKGQAEPFLFLPILIGVPMEKMEIIEFVNKEVGYSTSTNSFNLIFSPWLIL